MHPFLCSAFSLAYGFSFTGVLRTYTGSALSHHELFNACEGAGTFTSICYLIRLSDCLLSILVLMDPFTST